MCAPGRRSAGPELGELGPETEMRTSQSQGGGVPGRGHQLHWEQEEQGPKLPLKASVFSNKRWFTAPAMTTAITWFDYLTFILPNNELFKTRS